MGSVYFVAGSGDSQDGECMTRKKPKEGFVSAGWVKDFKLQTDSSGDLPDVNEEVVEELKQKLGDDYPAFEQRLEEIARRFLTQKELSDERPDTGEQRAMLNRWYRRIQSLYELKPDSDSEDQVSVALRRMRVDYYEVKKRMREDLSIIQTGITMAEQGLDPSPTGRRPKLLNKMVAKEIAALLAEYRLPVTQYKDNIWGKLLQLIYAAGGENVDPRHYTRMVKTLPK